ncbi:3551_t:CDS:2 [Cetraspora pellucida]|uniref:3551_t:CDS:1 n=1 Tax=Cetraspora pellucida TaxID=1433469 RepID=A0ACA9LS59_9GLOM|nr:3551_t:CDS:2 [Cetraspora pellucida]
MHSARQVSSMILGNLITTHAFSIEDINSIGVQKKFYLKSLGLLPSGRLLTYLLQDRFHVLRGTLGFRNFRQFDSVAGRAVYEFSISVDTPLMYNGIHHQDHRSGNLMDPDYYPDSTSETLRTDYFQLYKTYK